MIIPLEFLFTWALSCVVKGNQNYMIWEDFVNKQILWCY